VCAVWKTLLDSVSPDDSSSSVVQKQRSAFHFITAGGGGEAALFGMRIGERGDLCARAGG